MATAMARASSGLAYPERFFAAATYVGFDGSANFPAKDIISKFSKDAALLLYGLYQQATIGPCTVPEPSSWRPVEQSKWERVAENEEPFSAIEGLMVAVGDFCRVRAQDCFPKGNKYGDGGDPRTVFNVLDAMLKDNLERLKTMRDSRSLGSLSFKACSTTGNFNHAALIQELCLEKKLGSAMLLRKKCLRDGVILDVLTHNYILNGLCKTRDMEKAEWLFKDMLEMGPPPNCVTYNTMIKGYCLINYLDKALIAIDTMTSTGIRPNMITWNTLVHSFCKKGHLEDAFEVLGLISGEENPNITKSTILMDAFFKRENAAQALEQWEWICKQFSPRDVVSYNVLINGFCLNQEMKAAYGILGEMFKSGLCPDIITYNTLISAHCKEGSFEEALRIYSIMSKMGVSPDEISYKILVKGLSIRGQFLKVREFLLSTREKVVMPEPQVWNHAIYCWGRLGHLSNALYFKDQMLALGVTRNVFTFNALIYTLVKEKNIAAAYSLEKEMRSHGISPDVVTYNILIGAACKRGEISKAHNWCDEMLRRGYEPDIITYTILMDAFFKGRKTAQALEQWEWICKKFSLIDVVAYNVLINGFCVNQEMKAAYRILGEMFKRGLCPNIITYNTLISRLCRQGNFEEASRIYSIM